MVIDDLRSELTQVQDVATHLGDQLGKALYIHDDAKACGYVEGFKKMQEYVILNPQGSSRALDAHLRAINLRQLELDPIALEHGGEIGREMIPNAFPPEDEACTTHLPEGTRGDLEGARAARFKGAGANPVGCITDLDALDVGFVEFEEDPTASLSDLNFSVSFFPFVHTLIINRSVYIFFSLPHALLCGCFFVLFSFLLFFFFFTN